MKRQNIKMRHVRDWYDLELGTILHLKKHDNSTFLETLKIAKSFGCAGGIEDSYLTPGSSLKSASLLYLGTDIIKYSDEAYAVYFLYKNIIVYSRIYEWAYVAPEIIQTIKL